MSVSVVLKMLLKNLGEGPHWMESSGRLLFVDIESGDIHSLTPSKNEHHITHVAGSASFAIPTCIGGVVIGNDQKIARVECDSGEIATLAELENKTVKFNDGKCDASGRLWTGTYGIPSTTGGPYRSKSGALYSLDKTQGLRQHLSNIDLSNGIGWTKDNTTMFYIDSLPRKIYSFDFNLPGGKIGNQQVVADFATLAPDLGLPDGMTIDAEDKLWVACFKASKVVRIDPATGQIIQEVKFPAKHITSCCFGGPDFADLYVTSARYHLSDEEVGVNQPEAGSLFKVTGLGVKGLPANHFEI
ncbi:regucalcin-like [Liolophura sinensis]|uniref:regucalcin-like n=1 Tax=Liolophura sinensis TaxID=3198878 RepID=UPI0031580B77